jgi:hypothetical protein
MTVAGGRTARVRVDYSQYQVAAGAEITVGDTVRIGLRRALPDRMTRSPFHGYPWQRV